MWEAANPPLYLMIRTPSTGVMSRILPKVCQPKTKQGNHELHPEIMYSRSRVHPFRTASASEIQYSRPVCIMITTCFRLLPRRPTGVSVRIQFHLVRDIDTPRSEVVNLPCGIVFCHRSLDSDVAVPGIMQPNGAVLEPNKFAHLTIWRVDQRRITEENIRFIMSLLLPAGRLKPNADLIEQKTCKRPE
jgi:ribosomal protein S18